MLISVTVLAQALFGWMTFGVLHLMLCYQRANTEDLELRTVCTLRMWSSPVLALSHPVSHLMLT